MSLLTPSGSHAQPEPLPSLPPSPTEEDLGGASLWQSTEDERGQSQEILVVNNGKGKRKGKGKAREVVLDDGDSDGALSPNLEAGYPPITDEEEESRKIEENLKRWEQIERQRRKATRDSVSSTAPSSIVGDVSRRASLLWPSHLGGGNRAAPNGAHIHTALRQTSEDALPLSDLNNDPMSPGTSKPASPTFSSPISYTATSAARILPIPPIVENPFEPPDSPIPLHSFPIDAEDASAATRLSSPPSATRVFQEDLPFDDQATVANVSSLRANSSVFPPQNPLHPPPRPIDLPSPKTPPPRMLTPGVIVSSPPERVPPPAQMRLEAVTSEQNTPEQEHRWWTDWLCGCREGTDRGGDNQAGRTNPNE
ncbi:hypothetical protein DFH11DRAFT_442587 [Phellopilus nigrolimitatus]|nr:hypothetical protein DFH11DRAFT_442587 [Phellopilus nigrolimitatus]